MEKNVIIVHGKEYGSYAEVAHDYDVEVQELLRLIKKGIPAEEAVGQCHIVRLAEQRPKKRPNATPIVVDGVAYQSLAEACRRIGISTGSAYQKRNAIMERTGASEYEATVEALQYLSERRKLRNGARAEEVTVAGQTYPSRHAAMQAYHLSAATVNARIARAAKAGQPITFEEALLAGRNRKYAAAEYGSQRVAIKGGQIKMLEYLGDELKAESFSVSFNKDGILHASRHLADDLRPIALQLFWATERVLGIRWNGMASEDAIGGRQAALEAANAANARYVGIKLALRADGDIDAICDTYVCDFGISARKGALAAVRQFIESCNMILAQWESGGDR